MSSALGPLQQCVSGGSMRDLSAGMAKLAVASAPPGPTPAGTQATGGAQIHLTAYGVLHLAGASFKRLSPDRLARSGASAADMLHIAGLLGRDITAYVQTATSEQLRTRIAEITSAIKPLQEERSLAIRQCHILAPEQSKAVP